MTKIKASVGILTYNSEKTLSRCLGSIKDFDDIIVCDGGSTDATVEIARSFGALVITQDKKYKNADDSIADFSGVRNQLLEATRYEWFIFIDSDEYVTPQMVEEIRQITKTPFDESAPLAYWMPRKRVYNGHVVDCSTTYPDFQMRFFHKSGTEGFIKPVHERIKLRSDVSIGHLKHYECVPFEYSQTAWRKKLNYYLTIEEQRHSQQPFILWLRHIVLNACKVSALYGFRLFKMTLFCRGHRMPLWYELMQYWYQWMLVIRTGKKYFNSLAPERGAE